MKRLTSNWGTFLLALTCGVGLLSAGSLALAQEILGWRPGIDATPMTQVRVDKFHNSDVAIDEPYPGFGWFWPFSSIQDVFTAGNLAWRNSFLNAFGQYVNHSGLHPAVIQPSDPNTFLSTYLKPYDYAQADFVSWLQANGGRTDFVEPGARRNNDYKGNLISPLVASEAEITQDTLKQTYGQIAIFNPNYVTLISDNRYNPMRWMGPCNEIHHREQAGMSYQVLSAPNMWTTTRNRIEAYRGGDRTTHLYLDYVIDLTIEDWSSYYQETTIWGIYNGVHPSASSNLNGKTHWNDYIYGNGQQSQGRMLTTPAKEQVIKLLETRLVPENIQISININWLDDGTHWRESEWMVASRNQQSSIYYPPTPGGLGFKPTINDTLNPWITDGGNNGNVGWHRHPINLLSDPVYTNLFPDLPVVRQGGAHWVIPNGNSSNTMWGTIDLTNYVLTSQGHRFFPGQRGYWVNQEVGYEISNPGETHGIAWAAVIIENHSMFKVKANITTLNVREGGSIP